MEYIASLSYGKDSIYMLEIIHQLKLPLDRIITVDVMATPTISAEFPPMEIFKNYADEQILKRYGLKVEHLKAKKSYEEWFYQVKQKGNRKGQIYGFPYIKLPWCNGCLKLNVLNKFHSNKYIQYIGFAINEKNKKRQVKIEECIKNGKFENQIYPLALENITEKQALDWCRENKLLSPVYDTSTRGGCWFCHNQPTKQLKALRQDYPEFYKMLLKWDTDSPSAFRIDGTTVHDYEEQFIAEDQQIKFFE